MSSPEASAAHPVPPRATAEAVIVNEEGMHLRPATYFATLATRTDCSVTVTTPHGVANGKSVLELAMLAAPKGTRLAILVEGVGCEAVLAGLITLVSSGFRG